MKSADVNRKVIRQHKSAFLSYNISRLRELIRYLPPGKLELFDAIPFLLHVNHPGLPAYLDDPDTPCGIYRFGRSGFYKRAVDRFGIQNAGSTSVGCARYDIQGLYLMGSSGTIGQTDFSDFDYWLLIDKRKMGEEKLSKIRIKLIEMERWSRQHYHHAVKFFLLDVRDLRRNIFAAVDAESSGSAQKTLLKEEFYRTFILIAGRIPYWAVLPSGLHDEAYRSWIEQAAAQTVNGSYCRDFIDLGNLSAIRPEECLGALLWQMYKAGNDPVKALIKASLIAYYFFFENHKRPLCDRVKDRFSERQLDSCGVDPYTVVFETVIEFLSTIQDADGLELLKAGILLRLLGHPFTSDSAAGSPKKELIGRLMQQWGWSEKKQRHFESYENWCEHQKRSFDEQLFQKLIHFYELILGSRDKTDRPFEMARSDLKRLTHQIAIRFQKKSGKLPLCSTWLRRKSRNLSVLISCGTDPIAGDVWRAHDDTVRVRDDEWALYIGHRLLEVIGWIFLNGFHDRPNASLLFQPNTCSISPGRAKKLCTEVCRFFAQETPDTIFGGSWDKMIVFVKGAESGAGRKLPSSADMLIKNSSGEVYFRTLDLRGVENHLLQCYSIANDAWLLMRIKEFNCVVSAWQMPDMSGLALLRIVRNDDRFHRMPFFLTDSAFTRIKVVQAGQAGVTGLFVKPFDAKAIQRKIRELAELAREPTFSEAENAYTEGMRYIEENDYESALKLFLQLTQKGESAEVYYNIGYIKTAQGQYEEAVAAFQKATELDRLFAKAYEAMGRAYRYLGKTRKAQECLQKAADIYIGREKMQDAEEVLNEILEISPDSVNVFNSLGVLYRRKGDLKTALSQYHKALKVHPNEPHIYYNIGRLYFDLKQTEKARSFFESALKLDPHFDDARDVLNAMELGAM